MKRGAIVVVEIDAVDDSLRLWLQLG